MRRPTRALLIAAGLLLAACATTPTPRPAASGGDAHPQPAKPPPASGQADAGQAAPPAPPVSTSPLASLAGWADEDHAAALAAFQSSCGVAREAAMRGVCQSARALGSASEDAARAFFEQNFRAEPLADPAGDEGLLTAYFAPEYDARDQPDAEFSAPVRPKPGAPVRMAPPPPDPTDAIDVVLARTADVPAERIDLLRADRSVIDESPPNGSLAWMRPEDLFFLQIQGSGVLRFPDGRRMKANYAGDNGKPFVAIARPMVKRGLLRGAGASGDNIRAWLAAHRGPEARAIMWLNPRYVFFNVSPDDGRQPPGAAGVPLPPGRAIAVDPSRHPYGELFWIDASAPVLAGAFKTYRRLTVSLDTGAAIRGEVRADLYIGRGDAAGAEAGRVRHTLRMTRLVPLERRAEGNGRPLESAWHETAPTSGGG